MTKRFKTYLKNPGKKSNPLRLNSDVAKSPDNKIDQDFPGFPYGQSKENIINPVTNNERKTAGIIENTDEEKRNDATNTTIDESSSDASGSAFDLTERVRE